MGDDPIGLDPRLRQVEAGEGVGLDLLPGLRQGRPQGQVGGHGGEQVTSVERRRDRLQPEGGTLELHRLGGAPEPLQVPVRAARCRGPPGEDTAARRGVPTATARRLVPTPGSTTAEVDPGRAEGQGVGENERTMPDTLAPDPVGEVDDREPGAICAITARQTPANSSSYP